MRQTKIIFGIMTSALLFPHIGSAAIITVESGGWLFAAPHMGPAAVDCAYLQCPWMPFSIWLDPGMIAATGIDLLATKKHDERTIDAADAVEKLKASLEGCSKGGASDGEDTSGDAALAATYTPQINVDQSNKDLFDATRDALNEYLFETAAGDIKSGCTQSDKDCATARQSEWLLASVTLASATADKVLDQTFKNGKLEGHFQSLAAGFNSEKTPMGLYNQMANIVLDTHRQINDANALLGRDLEAQGLRAVRETGPVLLDGSKTEE